MYKKLNKDDLSKNISKELLSHILGREVYGFCQDNDEKDKKIITTCYMLYNNLDKDDYTFSKLELAYLIKEWIRKTSKKYKIYFINIHSGFDDNKCDGYYCTLEQGNVRGNKFFFSDDEVLTIIMAGQYYLETYYDMFLHQDKKEWK